MISNPSQTVELGHKYNHINGCTGVITAYIDGTVCVEVFSANKNYQNTSTVEYFYSSLEDMHSHGWLPYGVARTDEETIKQEDAEYNLFVIDTQTDTVLHTHKKIKLPDMYVEMRSWPKPFWKIVIERV